MTVAVLGEGAMGRAHLHAWRSLGVPAQGYGRSDAVADALATHDVVDICTPTPTHADLVRRAAAAGRHVICEKPLALTAVEAERMVAACAAAGVRLIPAHVVRWFPSYAEAKRSAASGELGDVRSLRLTRHVPVPAWADWFTDPARSGGLVTDLMIHDLDLARWIAGDVVGLEAERTAAGAGGAEAVTVRLVHHTGAVSVVEGSWWPSVQPLVSTIEVTGTAGRFCGDQATGGRDPYADQLDELHRAITKGSPARVSAEDGVEAVRLAERARAALALRPSEA